MRFTYKKYVKIKVIASYISVVISSKNFILMKISFMKWITLLNNNSYL